MISVCRVPAAGTTSGAFASRAAGGAGGTDGADGADDADDADDADGVGGVGGGGGACATLLRTPGLNVYPVVTRIPCCSAVTQLYNETAPALMPVIPSF